MCTISFEAKHIYRSCEEKNNEIGCSDSSPCPWENTTQRREGHEDAKSFCKEDRCLPNSSKRDVIVCSGGHVRQDFCFGEIFTHCCKEIVSRISVLRESAPRCISAREAFRRYSMSLATNAARPRSTKARRYSFSMHESPRELASVSNWKIRPSVANVG